MGAAFGAVVTAFVKDLLTPLIAALAGKPDFSAFSWEMNGAKFLYGDFLNAVISFLLIALAVYYFVVLPMNALMSRLSKPAEVPAKKTCPECLSEIARSARRWWRSPIVTEAKHKVQFACELPRMAIYDVQITA